MRYFTALLACFLLTTTLPASSHEFWMKATAPTKQGMTNLSLHVGENFDGQLIGWTKSSITALRLYRAASSEDLHGNLSDIAVGGINLRIANRGTHIIALDSEANTITLGAEKFHAYLHEEGLDAIIQQRETAGNANLAGRERYRRHVKALLAMPGAADASFNQRTGQRLEIVPLRNPLTSAPGATIPFTVLFEGKPLADALVKAWHKHEKHGKQLLLIKAHTDAKGELAFTLPYAGPWMISVVHMVAANDAAADWDSLWGNLTFDLPRKK